jgi:hypothetical protein
MAGLTAACSSDDDTDADAADADAAVTERLAAAADEIEGADGLHVEMRFVLYQGEDGSEADPDEASCVAGSFEPAGTSETSERAHLNFGTPHEDYDNYGCLLGTTFTVDGTRVYAHTDEPAPGTANGLLSRVGETTPELLAEMTEMTSLDADSGTELVALAETATGVEQVDDDTVVFEIDPDELAGNAPPEAATDEPADTVRLTAAYDPSAPERLGSLEYEVTAGDVTALVTYYYEDYGQPQGVEIPVAPYITPDVAQLTTLDELSAFVGLDR